MAQFVNEKRSFAALLQQHRRSAGLTQQELAERSGVSIDAISSLERGLRSRPRSDTVAMIADALGLAAADRDAFSAASRSARLDPGTEAPRFAKHNLPQVLDALVGREPELTAVRSLLLDARFRLLTLTGPPGVGKTRIALALAESLRKDFPDGVVFTNLAPVADPSLVEATVAQALGIEDDRRRLVADQLAACIGDHRLLLVLDNFEHVLSTGPALGKLLIRCPWLYILVTSRSALRLRGEHELPVPPLPLPEARTLFAHRASARSPGFELTQQNETIVSEICLRLGCLPLALELAAPWLKLLAPDALLGSC